MYYTSPYPALSRALAVGLLALGLLTGAASPLSAQSVQTKYERALAREQAARKASRPTIASLRAIAAAYEAIVRAHPRSGYSDNALWQGAGVAEIAFERTGSARDRDLAVRLLRWLAREYPSSSLARDAGARATTLARARPGSAASAAVDTARAEAPDTTEKIPEETPDEMPEKALARAPDRAPAPARIATAEPPASEAIALRSITHTALPKGDRVTLELSRELGYTADRRSNPDQLIMALASASASAAVAESAAAIRGTHVQALRLDKRNGGLQMVLQLQGQPRYSAFPLYEPYRLVIDVEADSEIQPAAPAAVPSAMPTAVSRAGARTVAPPASTRKPAPAAPPATAAAEVPETTTKPAPPSSTTGGGYSLARQLGLGVSRIVIDPGHGGHDPGAQANGVSEAELVLDVALRLEKLLKAQPGFEVVLTRRTNESVPLEQRTAMANRESADLFLSIHANSSPRTETRGVETYILNFATNSHAESVAARENASSAQTMRILPEIVRAIAMNNKLEESRELANLVQSSLVRRLKAQNKTLMDLGVKQAPFVVLIGAQMPSVLAEIAFLTNKAEATLLKQGAYRQRFAQALCDAVLKYQASLKKVATVAASAEAR